MKRKGESQFKAKNKTDEELPFNLSSKPKIVKLFKAKIVIEILFENYMNMMKNLIFADPVDQLPEMTWRAVARSEHRKLTLYSIKNNAFRFRSEYSVDDLGKQLHSENRLDEKLDFQFYKESG
jgi:hypothetical protein